MFHGAKQVTAWLTCHTMREFFHSDQTQWWLFWPEMIWNHIPCIPAAELCSGNMDLATAGAAQFITGKEEPDAAGCLPREREREIEGEWEREALFRHRGSFVAGTQKHTLEECWRIIYHRRHRLRIWNVNFEDMQAILENSQRCC